MLDNKSNLSPEVFDVEFECICCKEPVPDEDELCACCRMALRDALMAFAGEEVSA